MTGWVLDFLGEGENNNNFPLQVNGIGATSSSSTLNNFRNVQTVANQPENFASSSRPASSTQSIKYRQRGRGPLIPMVMPDRSGSLEDALVIRSKNALKKMERDQERELPIHQKQTVASQGKILEREQLSPIQPQGKQQSIFMDEPRGYTNRGGATSERPLNDVSSSEVTSSSIMTDSIQPSKALLKLKIVEFHSQQQNQDPLKLKKQAEHHSRNLYSQEIIKEVSGSASSLEVEMHPDGRVVDPRPKSTAANQQRSNLPYQQSMKRLPLKGPAIVEFGSMIGNKQAYHEKDEYKGSHKLEDYDENMIETPHLAIEPQYKDNKKLKKSPGATRPQTSLPKRDYQQTTSALVLYQGGVNADRGATTVSSDATGVFSDRKESSSVSQKPRRNINPQIEDVKRIQRYHSVQRPFSMKNNRYNVLPPPSGTMKQPPSSSHQAKRQSTLSSTKEDENIQPGSSIFHQTQLLQPETLSSAGGGLHNNYRTVQVASSTLSGGVFSSETGENLTREQIFNYLQNKKRNPNKAPYGLIQRDGEILDEKQKQIDMQRATLQSGASSQQHTSGANSVIRDVNYINIFMQPPTTQTQLSASKNLRGSYDERQLQETLENLIDHTSELFFETLDSLLKKTPLQEVIREEIGREKKKIPSFLYFHPTNQSKDEEPIGEDIGFEQNNQDMNLQSRLHAKLLDNLLQEILTGKFRETHWLGGINVHRDADTHWKDGVLRDRTDKYIDGVDLAKLFREKLQPKGSPSKKQRIGHSTILEESVEEDERQPNGSADIHHQNSSLVPYKEQEVLALTQHKQPQQKSKGIKIIDTDPLAEMLQDVRQKVSEHKEVQMDHIYEMNKQRFDEEVISTYIQSDRIERGKKDVSGAPKAINDDDDPATISLRRKIMSGQPTKLTMGVLDKAKEHYKITADKHKKEQNQMNQIVDARMQFSQRRRSADDQANPVSPRRDIYSPSKVVQNKKELTQRTMIYTCFLELVRQIGARQKDQGVLLLKIWHAYFDQFDHEIERIVESVKNKQREVDSILQSMKDAFTSLIKQKEHTEQRFFDLNQRIEELQKDLNVSRLIQKRDGELRKEAVDNFDRMKVLFPRCEEYLEKIKLNEVEAARTGVDRLKYLCKRLKKPFPNEKELPLIQDLDGIMSSITGKTVHVLNSNYEYEQLLQTFEQFKYDTTAKFNYMESLLLEKESELREIEEKRFNAEDMHVQTELTGKDLTDMLKTRLLSENDKKRSDGMGGKGLRSSNVHRTMRTQMIDDQDSANGEARIDLGGSSPLMMPNQIMQMVPQTPSVNISPYELLTPGNGDGQGRFLSSTKKNRGKPKKNLISSVAQSMSKAGGKSLGKSSELQSPSMSSQLLAESKSKMDKLQHAQSSQLLKLNPIIPDPSMTMQGQENIGLRSNTPEFMMRSSTSPQKTAEKPFPSAQDQLGHWNSGRVTLSSVPEEELKASDIDLDQALLRKSINMSIRECPPEQEEDSNNNTLMDPTMQSPFYDNQSNQRQISLVDFKLTAPSSPNNFSELTKRIQKEQLRGPLSVNAPSPNKMVPDIIEETTSQNYLSGAGKQQYIQSKGTPIESMSKGELVSLSSSESGESIYSKSSTKKDDRYMNRQGYNEDEFELDR